MRGLSILGMFVVVLLGGAAAANAQTPEPETREDVIEREQADKVDTLHPYVQNRGERIFARIQDRLVNQRITWYPFLENAYSGGGLALGLGYRRHVSSFNHVDVRGSYSILGTSCAEAEFVSPRLFHRRGELSVLGGWRDATRGRLLRRSASDTSSSSDLANYGFEQPYGSALLTIRPTRRLLMLRGGVEVSRWDLKSGSGSVPVGRRASTRRRRCPGLPTTTTYVHTQATVGLDSSVTSTAGLCAAWRLLRRHGSRLHRPGRAGSGSGRSTTRRCSTFPILRDTWVISLHGPRETTWGKRRSAGAVLPDAVARRRVHPARLLSWRFRDRNSLLLQARVADHRQPLLRDRGVLRRRQSGSAHVGSRPRRLKTRLRLRRAVPCACARPCCASTSPGAAKGPGWCSRRPRRF